MAFNGILALGNSKKYTNDTVVGMGAIKGASCTVKDYEFDPVTGNTIITFAWLDTSGVEHTEEAIVKRGIQGIPGVGITSITKTGTTGLIDTYTILYSDGTSTTFTVTNGESNQIQSDWSQTDTTAKDFIKNKPTALSDFTNDEEFIDNTVNDLVNYYLKTEIYTQSEVNDLIAAVNQFNVEIVATLPTTDIDTHTIYFVPKETAGVNDVYNEYIYINNDWELIGTTEIDLSQYYTKTETDALLDDKADAAITEYSTTEQVIGKWINGKPIYRKVVTGNTSSTSGSWEDLATIENIDVLINMYGFCTQPIDGTQVPCNYYRHQDTLSAITYCSTVIGGDNKLKILSKTTNMPVIITIEYTKTTD